MKDKIIKQAIQGPLFASWPTALINWFNMPETTGTAENIGLSAGVGLAAGASSTWLTMAFLLAAKSVDTKFNLNMKPKGVIVPALLVSFATQYIAYSHVSDYARDYAQTSAEQALTPTPPSATGPRRRR